MMATKSIVGGGSGVYHPYIFYTKNNSTCGRFVFLLFGGGGWVG